MDQFVSEGEHVKQCVQMTGRCMQIYRFYWVAAGEMNAVKALGQTEQILVVLAITRAAPAVKVRYIRRAGHLPERGIGTSEYQGVIWISRL